MATNQVCPLGAPDYSSYLLNIANSGADVFININFGNDAIQSIKQAKQFGVLDKMTLVVPYNTPFLARDVAPDLMQGVLAATDFWWTLEDTYPLAKGFVAAFEKKYGYKPEWGANSAYMQVAMWADAVSGRKASTRPTVIKAYEAGQADPVNGGRGVVPPAGPPARSAGDHRARQEASREMKNADDYYEIVEVVPGGPLMQKPDAFGCKLGDYA